MAISSYCRFVLLLTIITEANQNTDCTLYLLHNIVVAVLWSTVADPGNRKGGFQTIEREARGVKSAQSAQNLGLRPHPVQ